MYLDKNLIAKSDLMTNAAIIVKGWKVVGWGCLKTIGCPKKMSARQMLQVHSISTCKNDMVSAGHQPNRKEKSWRKEGRWRKWSVQMPGPRMMV